MSTNVVQCKHCGILFQSFGAEICPKCTQKLDGEFIVVKEYLYDHPHANITEIAKDTGVEERTILHFLREGRLSVDGESGGRCEECGAPISSGKLCKRCKTVMDSVMQAANKIKARKEEARQAALRGGKMHMDYGSRGLWRGDKQ